MHAPAGSKEGESARPIRHMLIFATRIVIYRLPNFGFVPPGKGEGDASEVAADRRGAFVEPVEGGRCRSDPGLAGCAGPPPEGTDGRPDAPEAVPGTRAALV